MSNEKVPSVYSFKSSMSVLPAAASPRKLKEKKAFTIDPTKKKAMSIKNASVHMEISALSKSGMMPRETLDARDIKSKNKTSKLDDEITAVQGSYSNKDKSSNKQQSILQRTRRDESKMEPESWMHEDDEPIIEHFNFATFLDRHYEVIGPGVHRISYTYAELKTIATAAMTDLKTEPALIEVRAPVIAVGDIHGQYNDLINIFITMGRPPSRRYIFLGDYVDRGAMSLECISLLLAYKILYPNHVYLLRGNHECARVNKKYGFYEDLEALYPGPLSQRIWALFQRVFNMLPIGGIIENRILCMHGGLSPLFMSMDQMRNQKKPIRNPSKGVVNDFLWSDPLHDILFWRNSVRGSGFSFGQEVVNEVCDKHKLDLILRAHQLCMDGFWTFAKRRLMTIFSAPAYCNVFKNTSSVLKIDENLHCQLVAFVPDSVSAKAMIEVRKTLWEPDLSLQPPAATHGSHKPATSSNPKGGEIKRPMPTSCT